MKRKSYLPSALLLTILVGCGGSDLEKVVVSGNVMFQGEPIPNGDILFYPKSGTLGPVSGAPIKDGQYTADGKGGVPVGEHRVVIRAFRVRETTQLPEGMSPEDMPGQRLQYLPEKFNDNTVLAASIPSGVRRHVANFDLSEDFDRR